MIKHWFRKLGPGLITASVVVGPGSIVAASKAGAHYGYSLVWLLVSAALFMAAFTLMGARVGCASDRSILTLAADRFGRWLAAVVGISCFFVVAGFQFGNNLGVATAMEGIPITSGIPAWVWPVFFTAVSLFMLFAFKNLYQALEMLMKVLVGVMVVSFVANLFYTGIRPIEFVAGFVPSLPEGSGQVARGMFPTTFSVVAALYVSHLVQEKRWKGSDSKTAGTDAMIGISMLCFISLTILCGAAGAFHGREVGELGTAGDLAQALEGLFGSASKFIFCFGLAAASFSSFLVNAMAGGGLLADGFGLSRSFDRWPVKVFTTLALLVGMGVAVAVLAVGMSPVTSLLLAQASTLLAVPICAILLLILANDRRLMGNHKNGIVLNLIGALGFCVLCWMTWNTVGSIWGRLKELGIV
jgi:Mn2+/Fe2+ NRAMP family transporter